MTAKIKPFSQPNSLIIFVVILALWMGQTKTVHESWSESSRLAAIQSLGERGDWRIDASPYGQETGDKVLLNGHYYSDKPPLFAAIGAILYKVMRTVWQAALAFEGCQPGALCVYYWLTVLMVGLPSALLASFLYRLFAQSLSQAWATGLTALFCFGTVIWPYSLVLNNHLPAAAALFFSFYGLRMVEPGRYQLAAAGLWAGTAVMFDLTAIFLAAALFLMVVLHHRNGLILFLGAALIPAVPSLIFNYQITGHSLFPYFSTEGYNYPGSTFNTLGGQRPPDSFLSYSFRNFIGDQGLLAFCPLLLFAAWGLIQTAQAKAHPRSAKSALILLGIIGHIIFVLTRTHNFGGDAYGGRYFIPMIPILYSFIAVVIPARFYKPGGWWVAGLGGVAALVSLFSAYQGVKSTWHQVNPPFYAVSLTNAPYLALKTSLNIPNPPPTVRNERQVRNFEVPEISHRLDLNFNNELRLLGYDLPLRRVEAGQNLELTLFWQSLRVAQGDYFVFTHLLDTQQTRQGGLDRRLQEGYPLKFWYPGEVIADQRHIPVNPNAANSLVWLRIGMYQMEEDSVKAIPILITNGVEETSIALGPVLVGAPPQAVNQAPQTPLAIRLGQPPLIMLRGYNLTQTSHHLHLTLYWESLTPTPTDWTSFVHLRNEAGETVAQKDGPLGSGLYPTSLWLAGERVADDLVLSTAHLPEADYSLFVGVYDLVSGERLAVPNNPASEIKLAKISH